MAKRFIDTDIFKKRSIRCLEAPYKLLYIYLFTDCNHAGIWEVDLDVAGLRLGTKFVERETVEKMGETITVFDGGAKWYINSFVEFQYGELNPNNRAHKSVLEQLKKYFEIQENKPLISPLQGAKDMDKDMDKVKDKDKDKEKPHEIKNVILPFQTENFMTHWGLWKSYKKNEHKFSYKTIQSEQAALMQLANLSNNNEQAAIEIINQSLSNGWKGFFEIKQKANTNGIKFTADDFE